MSEMVERVARAIHHECLTADTIITEGHVERDPVDMSRVNIDGPVNLLALVQAVLVAMRGPTRAMVDAARNLPGHLDEETECRAPYTAMIDAAKLTHLR